MTSDMTGAQHTCRRLVYNMCTNKMSGGLDVMHTNFDISPKMSQTTPFRIKLEDYHVSRNLGFLLEDPLVGYFGVVIRYFVNNDNKLEEFTCASCSSLPLTL